MAADLNSVVKQLADSGIIAPGKLENFIPPKADPRSVEELVQALVQSENLTAFQGQQVKGGKAKALILGAYTILDRIGAGGMGQVFKAAVGTLWLVSLALAADCGGPSVEELLPMIASHDPWQQQYGAQRLIRHGRRAMPSLVKLLADPGNDVRAWAAYATREILAATPSAAYNDHGEAFWRKELEKIKLGMSLAEIKRVVPCVGEGGGGSGPWMGVWWQLDDYWAMRLDLWEGTLGQRPRLERNVLAVWGPELPKEYTGHWTWWYVNGQKARECELRDGKAVGRDVWYQSNGQILK